ncbi:MAG: TetR/AcrR family transcriptional regulator [Planctomycetota bacterium]
MGRRDQSAEQRQRLLPIISEAFVELGYRRATTAELARRCDVRENILYRLWEDKKAMFIASVAYVFESSVEIWKSLGESDGSPAELLLDYESEHHGEFGNYRLLFSALGEVHDPEIRAVVRDTYRKFFGFIREQLSEHFGRADRADSDPFFSADVLAWAIIGLGTATNVASELDLMNRSDRKLLLGGVAKQLLGDATDAD